MMMEYVEGKAQVPLGKPRGIGLYQSFTRARAHAKGPETTKPCMLSNTSQQQLANFVGLALVPRQGYRAQYVVLPFTGYCSHPLV
jgi:hypothetical protein